MADDGDILDELKELSRRGQHERVIADATAALTAANADASLQARLYWERAWAHGEIDGGDADARSDFARAAGYAESAGMAALCADVLRAWATFERYRSDFDRMHALCDLATQMDSSARNQAHVHFLRGSAHNLVGDFTSSAVELASAEQHAAQVDDPSERDRLLADVLREQGAVSRVRGAFDQARDAEVRAARLYRRRRRMIGLANAMRELGACEYALGNPARADKFYAVSGRLYEQNGSRQGAQLIDNRRAYLLFELGDLPAAKAAAVRCANAQAGRDDGSAGSAWSLAAMATISSDPAAAQRYCESSRAAYQLAKDNAGLALVDVLEARALVAAGEGRRAVERLSDLVGPGSVLATSVAGGGPGADVWADARYTLAEALQSAGDPRGALRVAREAVDEWERRGVALWHLSDRRNLYRRQRAAYLLAMRLAVRVGDAAAAIEVAHSGRSESLVSALAGAGGVVGRAARDVRELRDAVNVAAVDPRSSQRRSLSTAHRAGVRRLEDQVSESFRRFLLPSGSRLDPDDFAVSPVIMMTALDDTSDEIVVAWLGPSNRSAVWTVTDPEVTRLVNRFRDQPVVAAETVGHDELSYLGDRLFGADLLDVCATAGRATLIIDRGLGNVPVSAMFVGRRRIADECLVTYAPAVQLSHCSSTVTVAAERRILGVFDPRLQGTRKERRSVLRAFGDGEVVQPADLTERLARREWHTAVFGCHGDDGEGLSQQLLLDSSKSLTAMDVVDLDLPPLVVLGACWSSSPRAGIVEEGFGMQFAALMGGARTVVGCLWEVDSRTTGQILASFYDRLASGRTAGQALHEAVGAFLRRHPHAPLVEWAGLHLVGDPNLVVPNPRRVRSGLLRRRQHRTDQTQHERDAE